MNKLDISDPTYEVHYVSLCRHYPEASGWVKRPARRSNISAGIAFTQRNTPPALATNAATTNTHAHAASGSYSAPPVEWPTDRCFYCAIDGCSMRKCPRVEEDLRSGLVKREGAFLVYKTGERLRRREGGFREDVTAKRTRDAFG